MKKILAYDPKKKKEILVGEVNGDVFTRIVGREHFMNVVQGYGIQETAFAELLENGVKKIRLIEKKTKRVLESKIQDWLDKDKVRVADYGHGKQRFIGVKYMTAIQKDLFEK